MKKNVYRAESAHKSDTFTHDQFDWLRQVAADDDLLPSASRVAIGLTKYFNRHEDGWAWMAQTTLAKDLAMPERTLRHALAALVERGHLISERRGLKQTNRYKLSLKDTPGDRQEIAGQDRQPAAGHDRQTVADHSGVTGRNPSSDRQPVAALTGNQLPINPLKEPSEEPSEGRDSPPVGADEDQVGADFERFWRQYPKRVAKAAALKAYRAVINKKLATPDEILAGVMRYAAEREGQDPKYTKHAATWLHGECWADEPVKPIADTIDAAGNPYRPPPSGSSRRAPASWDEIGWVGFNGGRS